MRGSVFVLCGVLGALPGIAAAQEINLMPMPSSVERQNGALVVTPSQGKSTFTVGFDGTHDARLDAATRRMLMRLDYTCGGDVRRTADGADGMATGSGTLTIHVDGAGEPVQGIDENESYSLTVTPTSVTLNAATDVGAMHGMETLLQLAGHSGGACVLPAVTIHDAPRFPWRGYMIDVSRHFEPIDEVERTLDGMAIAKLNVFHWHLSDDQGFRAESKKYPNLTAKASEGQFYTQSQMREVVEYARARGIRVVPEFDIPGHSTAAIVAYPELGASKGVTKIPVVFGITAGELDPTRESTYKFVDAFVGEMGDIFPDAYFHIGGDETKGKSWMENPQITAFMKKHGFAGPPELQAYFNQRLEKILTKHHKKMIGWDEILNPALPKNIVIQSWRGEASLSEGARQGYTGILSAPYYLDAQKTSAQMFLADPLPADTTLTPDQQKLVLGGEAAMWSEQIYPESIDSRVWPRTLAVAERFWSPQSDRDVSYMYQRLRHVSLELEDVDLQHITGPEKLRRNLAGSMDSHALDVFASVLEPVSFGQRYQGQHTDGRTTLDRMVDATVADPASRQEIASDVQALAPRVKLPEPTKKELDRSGDVPMGFVPPRPVALGQLRHRFTAWQAVQPELLNLTHEQPRLNDMEPRVEQLGQLAGIGLQALSLLESHTAATAEWQQSSMAIIDAAEKPSALVRFTFLPSLRKLVIAAGGESAQ